MNEILHTKANTPITIPTIPPVDKLDDSFFGSAKG